jgi:aspartate aminotransferase-like enzyme
MKSFESHYPLGLVPGPTRVPKAVSQIYQQDYASPDLEPEFFQLYKRTQQKIRSLLHCDSSYDVVIQSGEAMVVLWGAMKSTLRKRVLSVATGVFGYGFGEMAKSLGAQVQVVGYEYDEVVSDVKRIREAAEKFKPDLITMVHCETPSGTVNPVKEVGQIAKDVGALFYVDFVSSVGGCEVRVKVREFWVD